MRTTKTKKRAAVVKSFSSKKAHPVPAGTWDDLRRKAFTPAQLEEQDRLIAKDVAEYTLHLLRKYRGVTQVQLSELVQVGQGEISRIENAEDAMLSTVRKYVEALGGRLELHASFDDERVKLKLW